MLLAYIVIPIGFYGAIRFVFFRHTLWWLLKGIDCNVRRKVSKDLLTLLNGQMFATITPRVFTTKSHHMKVDPLIVVGIGTGPNCRRVVLVGGLVRHILVAELSVSRAKQLC